MTDAPNPLDAAARVLRIEGEALLTMAAALPDDFGAAVEAMLACKGRVILSGIGKSGHIARKIAATLSSTGTPAYFVHPAEASHGDLGTITPADIVLALSNSGETTELGDMIAHTRRFSIPLIALCSKAGSTLSLAADLRLILPPAPEACPLGMAPTTSTTMALALGDALAVALMERRGFEPEHFRTFHPGGRLGARLARVGQLMRSDDLPLVPMEMPMAETLLVMTQKGFGTAGVMDGPHLAGVITDGDLRRNMVGLMDKQAIDVATRNPLTAPPDMLAAEAVALMNERKITMLFVIDAEAHPLGILHIHDCLRAGVQ
ncbi:KpsF/GutQ family sugar-phosphate isomerase [Pseudorhodobacter turbinis]|uniref:KpsF/GutQ family sugar-phosphate isomerase n=1 Tax=Pseudorhodobacter turbinis TaxID=2500533 RepID=A0A4P8EIL7_9RHOB|nr:KpsF/GutQ family sugar-phosphate isomerase [Pseudorhodobacter turbinis]QCO56515.1 KpsF/GutQ family sugar-phosphate isomerase [Pseudorhodobacter turbinis]